MSEIRQCETCNAILWTIDDWHMPPLLEFHTKKTGHKNYRMYGEFYPVQRVQFTPYGMKPIDDQPKTGDMEK